MPPTLHCMVHGAQCIVHGARCMVHGAVHSSDFSAFGKNACVLKDQLKDLIGWELIDWPLINTSLALINTCTRSRRHQRQLKTKWVEKEQMARQVSFATKNFQFVVQSVFDGFHFCFRATADPGVSKLLNGRCYHPCWLTTCIYHHHIQPLELASLYVWLVCCRN